MRRALIAAGAALILGAPAFAQDVTIEKKTTTTTTEIIKEVPETGSTVSTVIIAPRPPPALQVEIPPPPPGPAMVWTAGRWSWNPDTQTYGWVRGKYLEPPRVHAAWVPGHWTQRSGGWVWVDGRWN